MLYSSVEGFFLPLATDVGRKRVGATVSDTSEASTAGPSMADAEEISLPVLDCNWGFNIGPFDPPPRTRRGASKAFLSFGVGSIESKEEDPAPVLRFFSGRSAPSSSVPSTKDSFGRAGKAIANFFGGLRGVVVGATALVGAGCGELGWLVSSSLP